MSICFLWASHLHRIQPVHISRWYYRPDAPVSRLTAGSKVNMLHRCTWNGPQRLGKTVEELETRRIIETIQTTAMSKSGRIIRNVLVSSCRVGWGCKIILRLLLCSGVGFLQRVSLCPGHDTKQFHGETSVLLKLYGMQGISLLPSIPDSLWHEEVAPDRILSMGQIELNCVSMLYWVVWNRTVLTFKLHTYAKLDCFYI